MRITTWYVDPRSRHHDCVSVVGHHVHASGVHGPSSTSPSVFSPRLDMERTSTEAQGFAAFDLSTSAEALAPSTTDIMLTARFNYSSESGLSVLASGGGLVQLWRVGGSQLLRGKEWHYGWRRQGHIHQPHRRPVRAHHKRIGP